MPAAGSSRPRAPCAKGPAALERLLHLLGRRQPFALTAIGERAGWAVRAARAAVSLPLPVPRARSVS